MSTEPANERVVPGCPILRYAAVAACTVQALDHVPIALPVPFPPTP